jgi:uncharacterized membrane protein
MYCNYYHLQAYVHFFFAVYCILSGAVFFAVDLFKKKQFDVLFNIHVLLYVVCCVISAAFSGGALFIIAFTKGNIVV